MTWKAENQEEKDYIVLRLIEYDTYDNIDVEFEIRDNLSLEEAKDFIKELITYYAVAPTDIILIKGQVLPFTFE